jgi:hypothetical protein
MHEARRVIFAGIALSASCVAYFCLLDHALFSSAHFSPIFRFLLTTCDQRTSWLSLIICLLAAVWKHSAPILRCVDFLGRNPLQSSLCLAALCAFGALVAYQNHPLSMDEYAAVFQSKIFASGTVFAQLPKDLVDWLVVRGFNGEFLVASKDTGRAVAQYWPGFALLLSPFQFLGIPWACNAALSGLVFFLIYWITKEITDDSRAAGWAMLFTLASGAFLAEGMSYYSMQAHLCANLLFVALLIRPSKYRAFGAGLIGSLALILHNPYPHVLFALPWIAATAMQRDQRANLLPLLLGYLPGAVTGLGWLMFRSDIGAGVHAPAVLTGAAAGIFVWPDAIVMNMRAAALAKMWIWGSPCLFIFAVLGGWRQRENRVVRLLVQSAALTFAGYLFVRFDQGHGWGYRYFHSAWGVIPILAGVAMTATPEPRPRLESFAGAAAILSLLMLVPFQVIQIHQLISRQLAQLPTPRRPGNNVYFIHPRGGFYVADLVQFDPKLRDLDLKLVSRGEILDTELIKRNWPAAIKIAATPTADQWYLGEQDQRGPVPGPTDERRWKFTQIPSPPSAAGR